MSKKLTKIQKGSKVIYFSRVKEAREALKQKALELFDMQMLIIRESLAAQEFETAAQANQYLIEHMPRDEDGSSMIDISIDKPKQVEGNKGPTIQIGISLGPKPSPKELPESTEVIDITTND